MSKRIDDIHADIKEIKAVLTDNTIKMGQYNAQLEVHIQGVRDLNARVKPIEEHVSFIRKSGKFLAWGVGLGAGIASIVSSLL